MKGMDFLEKLSETNCTNIVKVIAGYGFHDICTSCEAEFFRKPFRHKLYFLKIGKKLPNHLIKLNKAKFRSRLYAICGLACH